MDGFKLGIRYVSNNQDNNELDIDDIIKQKTESQLKDIVINRNLYSGKMISETKKELERRGISLTDTERHQMESNKQARIQEAKKNTKTRSNNSWLKRLFGK